MDAVNREDSRYEAVHAVANNYFVSNSEYQSLKICEAKTSVILCASARGHSEAMIYEAKKRTNMKKIMLIAMMVASVAVVSAQEKESFPDLSKYIITPAHKAEPRFNGAKVFGVRPGSPILYTVAVAGERPMKFSAKGLFLVTNKEEDEDEFVEFLENGIQNYGQGKSVFVINN